jgi:hypothetical protein
MVRESEGTGEGSTSNTSGERVGEVRAKQMSACDLENLRLCQTLPPADPSRPFQALPSPCTDWPWQALARSQTLRILVRILRSRCASSHRAITESDAL